MNATLQIRYFITRRKKRKKTTTLASKIELRPKSRFTEENGARKERRKKHRAYKTELLSHIEIYTHTHITFYHFVVQCASSFTFFFTLPHGINEIF